MQSHAIAFSVQCGQTNVVKTGSGQCSKAKISRAQCGRPLSEETKANISISRFSPKPIGLVLIGRFSAVRTSLRTYEAIGTKTPPNK